MSLHHVIPAEDRAAFLDCRRAWDFSARERGNRELARPAEALDLHRAIRDALAVYYFPGMWDWAPAIVLPLVRKAFAGSVGTQRAEYLAAHGHSELPPAVADAAAARAELGLATLEAYLGWAPEADELAPVQVVLEVDVQVPSRGEPDRELAVGQRPVRYRDRIDMLVMDADNGYWMVEHRFVHGPWPDVDALLRDDRCLSWCWAWQQDNPGREVVGTIYNEIRVGDPVVTPPPRGPRSTVAQHRSDPSPDPDALAPYGTLAAEYDLRIQLGDGFRRVHVPRSRAETTAFGERLADQLTEMIDPGTACYPNPATARCGQCAFRPPCLAVDRGGDAAALLAEHYRARTHDPKPGTLGARTWSTGRGAAPPPL
jgi:hypothetical protein